MLLRVETFCSPTYSGYIALELIWCWTGEPSHLLGSHSYFNLRLSPQSNGQAERANQVLESALRCVAANKPSSWSKHLPLVEYAQNSVICSLVSIGGLTRLPVLVLPGQEWETMVPSVQGFIERAQGVRRSAWVVLMYTRDSNQHSAIHRCNPLPSYQLGQSVCLSTRYIALATHYIPFVLL